MSYKPKAAGNQYRRRASNLRRMGFSSYQAYLASDLWKEIRRRVLERDGWTCKRCRGRATQVHHRSYVTKALDGTNIGLLTSVCRPCHEFCEFEDGRKAMPSKANARLRR